MSRLAFMVIQHDHLGRPPLDSGRYGTLEPVNLDGFYADRKTAEGVAEYMAEMRPDLETFVVEVVRAVRVHK